MSSANHSDSFIPTLTEVIAMDNTTPASELVQPEAVVVPAGTQAAWEELEKSLHEKVLRQLLTRVDFVVAHRIKEGVADVLQNAVDELASEIRRGLTKSLEDVIRRTIHQELAKVKTTCSDAPSPQ